MSTLNVDKVDPSTGTTLELGTSGDTINIPSGVTIANSGTATGFGAALTGSTNNTIPTVTGANAISGEANLTFDGTTLTVTGDGTITNSGTGSTFIVNNTSGAMANGACGIKISITDTSDPDNWYALRIDDGSSHKFSVTGSGLTTIDTLTASSDVQTGSAKQLITSSDQRLKNDKGLLTDGITKIKQLKPRYYKWKEDVEKNGEDNASQQLGFFSQEINPIIPEAANKVALKDKDGNALLDEDGNQDYEWGLNTRAIVGVLVKSVQELSEEIETLKTKVTALENA